MVTQLRNISYLNGYIYSHTFLLIEKQLQRLIHRHFMDKTIEIVQVQTMFQTQEKISNGRRIGRVIRTIFFSGNSLPSLHSILRMCVFLQGKTHQVPSLDLECQRLLFTCTVFVLRSLICWKYEELLPFIECLLLIRQCIMSFTYDISFYPY